MSTGEASPSGGERVATIDLSRIMPQSNGRNRPNQKQEKTKT
jgi:hypothetical protein